MLKPNIHKLHFASDEKSNFILSIVISNMEKNMLYRAAHKLYSILVITHVVEV